MKAKPWVMEKLDEALDVMRSLGATVIDDATYPAWNLDIPKKYGHVWKLVQRVELRNGE